eukprot:10082271-Alexandrium_andersonii.AAC.1
MSWDGDPEAEGHPGPCALRIKPRRAPRPHRVECAGATPKNPPLGPPTPARPEGAYRGSH